MHLGKPALGNIPSGVAFEDPEMKWNVIVFENCFLMLPHKKTTIIQAFVPDMLVSSEDTPSLKTGKYCYFCSSSFPACPQLKDPNSKTPGKKRNEI